MWTRFSFLVEMMTMVLLCTLETSMRFVMSLSGLIADGRNTEIALTLGMLVLLKMRYTSDNGDPQISYFG